MSIAPSKNGGTRIRAPTVRDRWRGACILVMLRSTVELPTTPMCRAPNECVKKTRRLELPHRVSGYAGGSGTTLATPR